MTEVVVGSIAALIGAELRKVWASRIPMAFLAAIVVVPSLFVFELYYVEGVAEHLPAGNGVDVLPILLFSTWKTLILPAALVAFCAFWVTVDSQYGMARVTCCLPFSRTEYLVGKWLALCLYVVLFGLAFILIQVTWVVGCSGAVGVGASDLSRIAAFSAELLALLLALALITMASASLRRTVGSGIVTAYLVLVVLGLQTLLPHRVLPPQLVLLRYFFFPLQELADPFQAIGHDSPFQRLYPLSHFWLVVLVTPLAFTIPALLAFRKRDVSE